MTRPPPSVSVVICAHNPRPDYLARTLEALKNQTLPLGDWDLLLVDNASREPLEPRFPLGWHPRGRVAVEPKLGLTAARLTGIALTSADLLVFVDDDNILAPDYLATALDLASLQPWIAAWGGRVTPEFETLPAAWMAPYLEMLAIKEVPSDEWSNYANVNATPPSGAGMIVRRIVAQTWAERVRTDPHRAALGRVGAKLSSSEDIDLAFTACDLGYGAGRFKALQLVHIIPTQRLEKSYMLRLIEGITASHILLRSIREPMSPPPPLSWLGRLREQWRDFRCPAIEREIRRAKRRGEADAYARLAESRAKSPCPSNPSNVL